MGRGSKQNSNKPSAANAPANGNNSTLKIDAGNETAARVAAPTAAPARQQASKNSHAQTTVNGCVRDGREFSHGDETSPSPLITSQTLISANQPKKKATMSDELSRIDADEDRKKQKSRSTQSPSFAISTTGSSSANNIDHHGGSSTSIISLSTKRHTYGLVDGTNSAESCSKRNGTKTPVQVESSADQSHRHSNHHHHRPLIEQAKQNGHNETDDDDVSEVSYTNITVIRMQILPKYWIAAEHETCNPFRCMLYSQCPLCLEVMDTDDLAFYPCTVCAYQICRFCWHRIVHETDATGETQCTVVGGAFCPNCRAPYDEQATLRATQRLIQMRQQQALNNANAISGKAANSSKIKNANAKNMPNSSKQQSNLPKNTISNINFPSLNSTTLSNSAGLVAGAAVGPHQRQPSINCRVVLKNLLFVQGVPVVLGHFGERWVRNLFERFGYVEKVIFTHTNSSSGDGGAPTVVMSSSAGAPGSDANGTATIKGVKGDTCGAFITYINYEHALESLVALNNFSFRLTEADLQDIVATAKSRNAAPPKPWTPKEGKDLCDKSYQMRVFLGTSKYCQNYLNGKQCMRRPEIIAVIQKQNRGKRSMQAAQQPNNIEICHYMHDSGDLDAIFTKEEITIGMHLRYQQRLINHYLSRKRLRAAAAAGGTTALNAAAVVNGSAASISAANNAEAATATYNRVFEQQQQLNLRVPVGMPAATVLAAAQAAAAAASVAAAAAVAKPAEKSKSASSKTSIAPPAAWAHPTLSVSKLFNNTSNNNSSKVTVIKQPPASGGTAAVLFSATSSTGDFNSSVAATAKIRSKGTGAGGAWGGDSSPVLANINNLEEFPPVMSATFAAAVNNVSTVPTSSILNASATATVIPSSTTSQQQQRPSSSSTTTAVKQPLAEHPAAPTVKQKAVETVGAEIATTAKTSSSGSTTPATSRPASSSKRLSQVATANSNSSSQRGSTASLMSTQPAAIKIDSVVANSSGAVSTTTKAVAVKKNSNKPTQPRVAPAPAIAVEAASTAADAAKQKSSTSSTRVQVVGRDSGCSSAASAESPLPIGAGGNSSTISSSRTGVGKNSTVGASRRSGSTLSSTSSSLSSLFPAASGSSTSAGTSSSSATTSATSKNPTSADGNSVFSDDNHDGSASVPPMKIESSSVVMGETSRERQQQQELFNPLQVAASAAYDAFLSPHLSESFAGSASSKASIMINSSSAFEVHTVPSSFGGVGNQPMLSSSQQYHQASPLFPDLTTVASAASTLMMPSSSAGMPLFDQPGSVHNFSQQPQMQYESQQHRQYVPSYRTSFDADDSSIAASAPPVSVSMASSSANSCPDGTRSGNNAQAALAALCRSLNINGSSNNNSGQFRRAASPQQQLQHQPQLMSTIDTVVPMDFCDAQSIEQYVHQQQQQRHQQQLLAMSNTPAAASVSLSTMLNNTPPPLFVNASYVSSAASQQLSSSSAALYAGGSGGGVSGSTNAISLTALSSSQMTPPWSLPPPHNTIPSPGVVSSSNNNGLQSYGTNEKGYAAQNISNNSSLFSRDLPYASGQNNATPTMIPSDEFLRHQWLLQQHQHEQEQQRLLLLQQERQQQQQHAVANERTFSSTSSYAPSLFDRDNHFTHVSFAAQPRGASGLENPIPSTSEADAFRSSLSPVSLSQPSSQKGSGQSRYAYNNIHAVASVSSRQTMAARQEALDDNELGFDPWAVSHDALSSMIGASSSAAPTAAVTSDAFDHSTGISNKLPSQATSSPLLEFMSMRCNYHETHRQQQRDDNHRNADTGGNDDDFYANSGRHGNNVENKIDGLDAATLLSLPRRNEIPSRYTDML